VLLVAKSYNRYITQFILQIIHIIIKGQIYMKKMLAVSMFLILLGSSAVFSQGKFSGYMFGDYYYNVMRDANIPSSNVASPAGGTAFQAFQFRRIYFTYDNDISEQFTSRFRLEADQVQETVDGTKSYTIPATSAPVDTVHWKAAVPAGTVSNQASKISVFVKDAYLKWKNVFSGSDLIFGIQPTPAYDVSEAAWGYRSLEKTIMDLRGIVSSRDMGISLKGKVTEDGMVNYWLMFANNSGNAPETDKYKRYYAHVQVKPITNLQATLYVDYKDVPDITAGSNGTTTTALFVGYSEPFAYNLNFEAFMTSQANAFTPAGGTLGSKNGLGFSVFGSYNVIPELAAILRYDYWDPNTDGSSVGDVRNYVIAGVSWKADKNVSIMPNVLYETYEAQTGHGAPDPSITARVTLNYIFL
jgi:hypothetical protein